jgi:glucosamine kinase
MSEDIFIGLDGGGTKTKLIVEDAKGNLIGNGRSGPANISLSANEAWHSVYDALNGALKHAKISLQDSNYNFHIGMGLAGTEIASSCESFLNHPHPFKTLILRSDAYTACIGAHEGKDGDIIIIGTGVIGFQIYNNIESQVNGWGFPHADEGGGAWLGMSVISLTLKWQDGRGEGSDLLAEVFKHFNNDLYDMVAWANRAKSTQFAELVPYVLNYIEQNDENAISLIKQSAKEIDKIDSALQKLSTIPLKCSLFGGIAPFIQPYLNENLKERLVNRKHDAAKGAIIMVKRQLKELI